MGAICSQSNESKTKGNSYSRSKSLYNEALKNSDDHIAISKIEEAVTLIGDSSESSAVEFKINAYLKLAELYKRTGNIQRARLSLQNALRLGCDSIVEEDLKKLGELNHISYPTKFFLSPSPYQKVTQIPLISIKNSEQFNLVYKNTESTKIKTSLNFLRKKIANNYFELKNSSMSELEEVIKLVKQDDHGEFSAALLISMIKRIEITDINATDLKAISYILKYTKDLNNLAAHEANLINLFYLICDRSYQLNKNSEEFESILVSISDIISTMTDLNFKGLIEAKHEIFLKNLDEIISNSNNFKAKYIAEYCKQNLIRVPSDKIGLQSFFRTEVSSVKDNKSLYQIFKENDLWKLKDYYEKFKVSLLQRPNENNYLWYHDLKYAQYLSRNKFYPPLELFLNESSSKKDPNFTFGTVYIIEDILKNEETSDEIKKGAMNFLLSILRETDWGLNDDSAMLIIYNLHYYQYYNSDAYKSLMQLRAVLSINKLYTLTVTENIKFTRENYEKQNEFMRNSLTQLREEDFNFNLQIYKEARLGDYDKNIFNKLYLPGDCTDYEQEKKEPKKAILVIKDFLTSNKKVLVVIGSSGAGKTSLILDCEKSLFEENKFIPFYINLSQFFNPTLNSKEILNLFLKEHKFTNFHQELKNREIVFLLDGHYDIERFKKIFQENNFSSYEKAKVIITIRDEAIPGGFNLHKSRFISQDFMDYLYSPIKLTGFNDSQKETFLRNYIKINIRKNFDMKWTIEEYKRKLIDVEGLKELTENPFSLFMIAEVFPNLNIKSLTKLELFGLFTKKWVEEEINKFSELKNTLTGGGRITDVSFIKKNLDYSKPITTYMFKNECLYLKRDELYNIMEEATNSNDGNLINLIIRILPIVKRQDNYFYLHKSIFDYFIANDIIEDLDDAKILNLRVIKEFPILKNLIDFSLKDTSIQEKLWKILEKSKNDQTIAIAASNAATILNFANIPFSNRDLSKVRIPYANLSHSWLWFSNFEGADLSKANLSYAYIHNCNFDNSNMQETFFGEYPERKSNLGRFLPIHEDKFYFLNEKEINISNSSETIEKINLNISLKQDSPFFFDFKYLYLAGTQKEISIFDLELNKFVKILKTSHQYNIFFIEFNLKSKFLVSASSESALLWNLIDETPFKSFTLKKAQSFCLNKEGTLLYVGQSGGRITKIDLIQGDLNEILLPEGGIINNLAVNDDSSYIACYQAFPPGKPIKNKILLVKWEGTQIETLKEVENKYQIESMFFVHNGSKLITQILQDSTTKIVYIFDCYKKSLDQEIFQGRVALDINKSLIAISHNEGAIQIYDSNNFKLLKTIFQNLSASELYFNINSTSIFIIPTAFNGIKIYDFIPSEFEKPNYLLKGKIELHSEKVFEKIFNGAILVTLDNLEGRKHLRLRDTNNIDKIFSDFNMGSFNLSEKVNKQNNSIIGFISQKDNFALFEIIQKGKEKFEVDMKWATGKRELIISKTSYEGAILSESSKLHLDALVEKERSIKI